MTEDGVRAYNTPDFELPRNTRVGASLEAKIGDLAPDFEALMLDGATVRLSDLRQNGHVVLMMGSITSPMCAIHVPAMNRLHADFSPRGVAFFLVYVRESHPAERYPHHASIEQKLAYARDLQRLENIRFPILVDSLDGAIHRVYGLSPAALFVVHRDGRLLYRSTIANPSDLDIYLEQVTAWDQELAASPGRRPHTTYSERLIEHEVDEAAHHRVYERAGPKAFEDYWRIFPAMRGVWPRAVDGGQTQRSSARLTKRDAAG